MKKFIPWLLIIAYCTPGLMYMKDLRQHQGYIKTSQLVVFPIILLVGPGLWIAQQDLSDKWFEVKDKK